MMVVNQNRLVLRTKDKIIDISNYVDENVFKGNGVIKNA